VVGKKQQQQHYIMDFNVAVADPEGAKGPCPQTDDRLKKSCKSSRRRDSVFRRWQ